MIKNEKIEISLNASNFKYYKNKGYIFNKIGKLLVNTKDLPKYSKIKIECICDNKKSNNETYITFSNLNKSTKNFTEEYFCKNCITLKREKNNLKKYGVKSTLKLKIVKNKIKQTNLERYGVDNISKLELNKEKIKQTNKKKYGVEYLTQNNTFIIKILKTYFNNKKIKFDSIINNDYKIYDYDKLIKIYHTKCQKIFNINNNLLNSRLSNNIEICTYYK